MNLTRNSKLLKDLKYKYFVVFGNIYPYHKSCGQCGEHKWDAVDSVKLLGNPLPKFFRTKAEVEEYLSEFNDETLNSGVVIGELLHTKIKRRQFKIL